MLNSQTPRILPLTSDVCGLLMLRIPVFIAAEVRKFTRLPSLCVSYSLFVCISIATPVTHLSA